MQKNSIFSNFSNWLKSTELFERPSKKILGKWQLYEYYTEPEEELQNVKEDQLKAKELFWELEFDENDKFIKKTNLSIPAITVIENGTWNISKNYITLIHPKDFRNNIEFQFAFDKGTLKLLKKDSFGKIEFFGFFNSIKGTSINSFLS